MPKTSLCGFTQILSLRDGFLDILEELGRCAVLDVAVWRFSRGVLFFTELTEYTEFFYFRTCCLTSSNALDGTHGVYIELTLMYLKHLTGLNYRNLRECDLLFSPKFNCFLGSNGMGKTNVLDAIYYLRSRKAI